MRFSRRGERGKENLFYWQVCLNRTQGPALNKASWSFSPTFSFALPPAFHTSTYEVLLYVYTRYLFLFFSRTRPIFNFQMSIKYKIFGTCSVHVRYMFGTCSEYFRSADLFLFPKVLYCLLSVIEAGKVPEQTPPADVGCALSAFGLHGLAHRACISL